MAHIQTSYDHLDTFFKNLGERRQQSFEKTMESLPAIVADIFSNEGNLQLDAIIKIRKLLCTEAPPIDQIIQSGSVPRFIEFLTREDFPLLQFEAGWVLTNIAAGTTENTRVLIDHGAVPILIKLLGSPNAYIHEQAAWALGNIACDSPENCDLVLSHGALNLLISLCIESTNMSILRTATWTLSNLCKGEPNVPKPVFEQVKPALEALQHLVCKDDEEVVADACWALSYLTDGTNDRIQAVIDAGVCKRLVELLGHPSLKVLIPTIRTVGNIVTGDELQTQSIINLGVLPCLLSLLTDHPEESIKKEVCWTISNITAGNKDQIQAVIEAGLIGPLITVLQTAELDIKKEAAWAISNASTGGTNEQIMYLVNLNCIKPLCDLLVCPDAKTAKVCLDGLESILGVCVAEKGNTGSVNYFAQLIHDAEGSEKIANLQTHDNNEISEKAVRIFKTYWRELPKRAQPTPMQILARL